MLKFIVSTETFSDLTHWLIDSLTHDSWLIDSFDSLILYTPFADQGRSKTVSFFRTPSKIFMSGTWNFRIIERNIKAIFREYFSSLREDSGKIFKLMTFRRGPRTTYCTSGPNLTAIPSVKDLDSHLSWNDDIDYICSKISKNLNNQVKALPDVQFICLCSLFSDISLPLLCCLLWNNYDAPLSKVVKLQNKGVRIIK